MSISFRSGVATLLVCAVAAVPAAADEKKDPAPVSGLFSGNGKEAKLAFVSAVKDEDGKGRVVIIFTEKNHSKAKNPRVKAFFGDYGSALIITVTPEGKVVGCEVAHAAHKKSGFTDIGTLETADFKIANGKVSGKLTTKGPTETFGEKWEVKLAFEVKQP
jgi:hypothetical protein